MINIGRSLLLTWASALVVQAQGPLVTNVFPLETVTWNIATALVTGTISAHTQRVTVNGITYSETVPGDTITENDGRTNVVRTISPETITRQIPSSILEASLRLVSITRTLVSSHFTETLLPDTITESELTGDSAYLYTLTGPISNGVAIGTIVEILSSRSIIKTIDGPTVTHVIGEGDEIVLTNNGVVTTQFASTSLYTESFDSTLITRVIPTSSITRQVTLTVSTPSPSGSVSGIESSRTFPSTPTVTFTQGVTASTTIGSTVIQTSVAFSTVGAPQSGSASQSGGTNTKCTPIPTKNSSASKCHTKVKPTKCHTKH
ncbi:hypothetical protein K7432_009481 [Basidiobolus ranarum]|uniref:Uncharacterized protein n=1 Tax=Basidiobolus ranarum TaxID=34480 RepID=A0ABR2WQ69_9FUNG